jgi:hypothetical protein
MLKNTQTFNDGVVKIYRVANIADDGDKPVEVLMLRHTMRYAERTVGIQRHYAALQANSIIKHLLRVPLRRDVSAQDVAIPNDGNQYRISLVQYPEDIYPPVMDLTLEEMTAQYDIGQADLEYTLSGGSFAPWDNSERQVIGGD